VSRLCLHCPDHPDILIVFIADTCEQDFKSSCPVGWVDLGDGVCNAPVMYGGKCNTDVKMVDEAFREEFGTRCDVRWPCTKLCKEDFRQTCPTGWATIDGICTASAAYSGPCVPFAHLADASEEEKKSYAGQCEVDFCERAAVRRVEDCEFDDAYDCPIGWAQIGSRTGYCHGIQYQGPCRSLVSIMSLDAIGKKLFMEKCGVRWQCKADIVAKTEEALTFADKPPLVAGPISADGRLYAIA